MVWLMLWALKSSDSIKVASKDGQCGLELQWDKPLCDKTVASSFPKNYESLFSVLFCFVIKFHQTCFSVRIPGSTWLRFSAALRLCFACSLTAVELKSWLEHSRLGKSSPVWCWQCCMLKPDFYQSQDTAVWTAGSWVNLGLCRILNSLT